ncbi:MAG: metalloregulator ArsR/SmtB family transcription factor [Candidatus Brocadiales bacterium]|nr:metalloregulator ArsR/SmtB family transcription factor [Candidatus Brocadiales bacterium]
MKDYVEVFKALADPTRLRILYLLAYAGKELCVCEFVDSLEEPQYNVSRHLRVLRQAGLLKERKEGRWVYYSLSQDRSSFKDSLLKLVRSISIDKKDVERLKERLCIRVKGRCVLGIQKGHLLSKKGGRSHVKEVMS